MTCTRKLKRVARWLTFVRLPILAGPLRGKMWLPASRGKLLRLFTGTYERTLTRLFLENVGQGDVVLDVGANVGYFTVLSSLLTGPGGRVIAFEPVPEIAQYLRKHVTINRLSDVTVYEAAVGERRGVVTFESRLGTGRGRVSANGNIEVPLCRIDDVVAELGVCPTHMKIDVEGYGREVLRGANHTIRFARPTIYLSTHGSPEREGCRSLLAESGYTMSKNEAGDLVCQAMDVGVLPTRKAA